MTQHEKLALAKLQEIGIRKMKPISVLAPNNPEYFIETVKSLIDQGYKEYEFSNDYKFVKRLDMCTFGIQFFEEWQKLNM